VEEANEVIVPKGWYGGLIKEYSGSFRYLSYLNFWFKSWSEAIGLGNAVALAGFFVGSPDVAQSGANHLLL
jgi:hypothetical protein